MNVIVVFMKISSRKHYYIVWKLVIAPVINIVLKYHFKGRPKQVSKRFITPANPSMFFPKATSILTAFALFFTAPAFAACENALSSDRSNES